MKTRDFFYLSRIILIVLTLLTTSLIAEIESQNEISNFEQADFKQLTGRVVTALDPQYNVDRLNWDLYLSRHPLAIVFVQNNQDILNALNFCSKNKIPFRIRSGGHGLEGWSTLDDGIIIDLRDMNKIRVDQEQRLAYVQPGAKQAQVVVALGELGYAIPTGLESTPSISGVTLGGGIGLSIREYGLACDYLIEVEMILASGEIVRATKDNAYKDLFFACQGGGGGNFGVVTELVYSIFPRANVIMYKIEYPYESLEILIDAWQRWAPFQTNCLNSALELFPEANSELIGVFNGSKIELLELLAPMLTIPGSAITRLETVRYADSWLFFANGINPPTNDKFSSAFVYKFLPSEAIHIIKDALDHPVNSNAIFWFLALGGAVGELSTTATPFGNRKALFYFEWDESWSSAEPEQADPIFAWVENVRIALSPFVKGAYVNVPDRNIPNSGEEYYGGDNFEKLKEIKRKYDPENFFTYGPQAIPPMH